MSDGIIYVEGNHMNRTPVKSSNIQSVGYDPEKRLLEVGFHRGEVYQYFGVPKQVYEGLLTAPSAGSYLHAHIKGKYPYQAAQ